MQVSNPFSSFVVTLIYFCHIYGHIIYLKYERDMIGAPGDIIVLNNVNSIFANDWLYMLNVLLVQFIESYVLLAIKLNDESNQLSDTN